MKRDILKTLADEHDAVRALFEKIKATTDRAEKGRSDLLDQIEKALIPHAKWEEKVFYPAFAERADKEGLKTHAEAVQEHRAVELVVLPDVIAAEIDSPQFAGRVKVFAEFIDHHAKEEEKTMFKMARELFTAEERSTMDEQYENWKNSEEADNAVSKALAQPPAKEIG